MGSCLLGGGGDLKGRKVRMGCADLKRRIHCRIDRKPKAAQAFRAFRAAGAGVGAVSERVIRPMSAFYRGPHQARLRRRAACQPKADFAQQRLIQLKRLKQAPSFSFFPDRLGYKSSESHTILNPPYKIICAPLDHGSHTSLACVMADVEMPDVGASGSAPKGKAVKTAKSADASSDGKKRFEVKKVLRSPSLHSGLLTGEVECGSSMGLGHCR